MRTKQIVLVPKKQENSINSHMKTEDPTIETLNRFYLRRYKVDRSGILGMSRFLWSTHPIEKNPKVQ
jgi:hypothetical protein